MLWKGEPVVDALEASWNVMAHAQKPVFVFRRNGRVHLNQRGASVQSTTGSRGVRISGSNARYTMFRGSVKGTGYPLHSPVSPSPPLPCVNVCRHISTEVYQPSGPEVSPSFSKISTKIYTKLRCKYLYGLLNVRRPEWFNRYRDFRLDDPQCNTPVAERYFLYAKTQPAWPCGPPSLLRWVPG